MLKKSKVLFKGKGSGLIIFLDESSSYDEIKTELIDKVKKSKRFFNGASEDIVFEGKKLTSRQENEIVDIIIYNSGMEVGFINPEPEVMSRKASVRVDAETEPLKFNYDDNIYEQLTNLGANQGDRLMSQADKVLIYHGFVRSGKLIESEENILIIGGVNPGGEVFAGKNVVVFGPLKGKAVAGKKGDKNCFIASILMEPELLGIDTYVTRFPVDKKDRLSKTPSIARLESGKITVVPIGNSGTAK